MSLPDSVLKEAPLLENTGPHRPALTGIDMEPYQPLRRQKLAESIQAQRAKLQEGSQK